METPSGDGFSKRPVYLFPTGNNKANKGSRKQDDATRTSSEDYDSGSDYDEGESTSAGTAVGKNIDDNSGSDCEEFKLRTTTTVGESTVVIDSGKAYAAYLSVINTLKSGLQATSLLLCEANQTGKNYRGILLDRSWGTGATVDEFITGRVQHDVNCSELEIFLNAAQVHSTELKYLSNKEIIEQLCITVQDLLKKYSVTEQMKFTLGEKPVNPSVVAALFNVGKKE